MPLGEHGIFTRSTLDHLTMYRLSKLKAVAQEKTQGTPFASGCVIRAAVALLFNQMERWNSLDAMEKTKIREILRAAKKAQAAPCSDNELQQICNRS